MTFHLDSRWEDSGVGKGGNARFPTFQLERDGPTDQRTDKASYRVACPQLKTSAFLIHWFTHNKIQLLNWISLRCNLTRLDTQQSSRGWLGSGSNAKTAQNSKIWWTDRRTDLLVYTARCRVACPRLKKGEKLSFEAFVEWQRRSQIISF